MLKIDKGIPVPHRQTRPSTKTDGNPIFPLAELDIGDSFSVPDGFKGRGGKEVTHSSIGGAIFHYGKRHGRQFTVRRMVDGWRVWRTA